MNHDFEGKVALITGGTSGIGRATAISFARAGASVVICGRREAEGQETIRLVESIGGQGLFIQADVSQENDVKNLVVQTLKVFGRLDAAFNNAAAPGSSFDAVTQTTVENFREVFDVGVLGVLLGMKYQIPAMQKNGGGTIVNNAGAPSEVAVPNAGLIVASKHAVVGLTKTAALEVSRSQIRVNAVSPAGTQTEWANRFVGTPEERTPAREWFENAHPMGRLA